jgi:hypothetical protein
MKKIIPLTVVGILILSGLTITASPIKTQDLDFQKMNNERTNVLSDDELDQSQTICDAYLSIGLSPDIPANMSLAQSFIPQKEVLTRVQLYMAKGAAASYPCVVAIREDLYGENLVAASINPDEFPVFNNLDDLEWIEFDFDDILLTPGETYYMVGYTAKVADNFYVCGGTESDLYPDGNIFYSLNGGKSWVPVPDSDACFKTYGSKTNLGPDTPTIKGPTSGKIGKEYEYTFVTIDPEDDDVYYWIDWGDQTFEEWIGPYSSGNEITLTHTWAEQGTYTIKAKAKDIFDAESEFGTLEVSMPKTKIINRFILLFLEKLVEWVPILD